MANPYFELEKAIIARIKASPLFSWPIYATVPPNAGPIYAQLSQVSVADASTKLGEMWDITISFDVWDFRPTTMTGTNDDVFEVLYVIDKIITLNNKSPGLSALSLASPFLDVSHTPFSGPNLVPNIDSGVKHANRKIVFKICI